MGKHKFEVRKPFQFTETQLNFTKLALRDTTKLIIVDGPSGSSKTYMAVYCALKLLAEKKYDHIVYIRTLVESSMTKFGTLPGESNDKFKPWSLPLIEKLEELLDANTTNHLFNEDKIRYTPINFLRGRTFLNNIVIIDEAQNLTLGEQITALTRIGENSKVFLIGDSQQADIGYKSGFTSIITTFSDDESKDKGIHVLKFSEEDIVRSEILKFIIKRVNLIIKKD